MKKWILILVMVTTFNFQSSHLEVIRDHPHLLGHLVGKDKLTELHSNWIKYIWNTDEHRSLQGHRGSYKTTAITEIGILWWLLFHPNDRIALIRKPYTEAAKTLRTVKNFFQLEVIQALYFYAHKIFPRFVQRKENSLIFNFKTDNTKEGNADAYGIGGNITGNHYDKIIIDDGITLKDRVSKAERESTKEFIMEVYSNIIDPGKQVGMIGTPWHKQDAWSIVPEAKKFPVNSTNILSEEELKEKKKIITNSLYSCNYLLEHIVSEDAIFKDPYYDRWDYKIKNVYGHLDAKYKGDCTNGLTFMAKLPDGKIQAVGFTSNKHINDWLDFVKEKFDKYRAGKMYNEENADKGYLASDMKKKGMRTDTYHESMNKDIKISVFLKRHWNNIIWAPETDPEYMNQILDWIEGMEPNDCPDSASSLLRILCPQVDGNVLYEM